MTGHEIHQFDGYAGYESLIEHENISFPPIPPEFQEVLSPEAIRFAADLHREFSPQIDDLLKKRIERQERIDQGELPGFLPETKGIRDSEWEVAPIPTDLEKRWVEITGPVDRKMMINAFNSQADVFMADFEDSLSPTWENIINGQQNLSDAVAGTIEFTNPDGKEYKLNDKTATLFVRPRGLHLTEGNVLVDGNPISASLFDFGIYFFNNAKKLIEKGTGPYFYLPKLQSHQEARLWNSVFIRAQEKLGIPNGTIKATVLIEHILAAFEMHEILYELKEHSAGLNAGRWDYLFSIIKTLGKHSGFILPNRSQVTMDRPMMDSYDKLLVETCHRRGVHAMGGMSAYIPVKDPNANEIAFEKVRKDKEREVENGHDGTWVAHPGLVPVARAVFESVLKRNPNQISSAQIVGVNEKNLFATPQGTITEQGVRANINVFLLYQEAWFNGQGAVPINNLMEDTATAEISRSQLWQWMHFGVGLDNRRRVSPELLHQFIEDEYSKLISQRQGENFSSLDNAKKMLYFLLDKNRFEEFLTIPAYQVLIR